jgi:hypothetical protein
MPFVGNISKVDWTAQPNAIELYDHGVDSECATDFNTCDNVNIASDPRKTEVIKQLDSMLREHFKS